jgi:hypothetical protein
MGWDVMEMIQRCARDLMASALAIAFAASISGCGSSAAPRAASMLAANSTSESEIRIFLVHLAPQHDVAVLQATSVSVQGNTVQIVRPGRPVETLSGDSPTVEPTTAHISATKAADGQGRDTSSCATYVIGHLYQATDYYEVQAGTGDFYYDLDYVAPTAYDNVYGYATFYWYGRDNVSQTNFNVTFGPYYERFSATGTPVLHGGSGAFDVDGGPTVDAMSPNYLQLNMTNADGSLQWEALGQKTHPRFCV